MLGGFCKKSCMAMQKRRGAAASAKKNFCRQTDIEKDPEKLQILKQISLTQFSSLVLVVNAKIISTARILMVNKSSLKGEEGYGGNIQGKD